MAILFISLVAVSALCATWYAVSLRRKREKSKEILRWIQASLAGRGHVVGISWMTSSRFRVPLRLTCGVFNRAWVLVEIRSQQTPIQWLFNKISGRREVLTFQADLDCPPTFSLQMQNFRWFARSSPKAEIDRPGWQFERLPSVMISTRTQSQKEIACTMTSLSKGDNGEFLEVSFQRRSPHFSATLPLEALAPGAPARTYMLDAVRELAGSASVF
ncbi:MAG TPA: hypothetical protein VNZ47_09620 [Candidatus Dormibacteraeota bacterium]|jgi:hypothetical protein|nr:hypothetical protein [Candidatus Dormibacteraeota bacterium]